MELEIDIGDRITDMPGSTHRTTWEVTDIESGDATLTLASKAVGYVTDRTTFTVAAAELDAAVENGVLFGGRIVKTAPDWEMKITV